MRGNQRMFKRLVTAAATLGAMLVLLVVLPIASASVAPSPWWQVLPGSRPTHIWEPKNFKEEIKTKVVKFEGFDAGASKIEIGGEVVGCLATQNPPGETACAKDNGFAPTETGAQLEALLESIYGTPVVEVTGGPVGGAPFLVEVERRGVLAMKVGSLSAGPLGTAEATVLSQGGSGRLVLSITNLGDAPVDGTKTPVTIVDELPDGLEATGLEVFARACRPAHHLLRRSR